MYKTLTINTLFENSYIEIQNNDVENSVNRKKFQHIKLIENHSNIPGSAVICELNEKFLVLKSYRYGIDKECWEIPRGYTNPEETSEACAIRELYEETNIDSSSIIFIHALGRIDVNSSILASSVPIFHIKVENNFNLIIQDDESIHDYQWLNINEIYHWIKTGKITDSFTISGFMLYHLQ